MVKTNSSYLHSNNYLYSNNSIVTTHPSDVLIVTLDGFRQEVEILLLTLEQQRTHHLALLGCTHVHTGTGICMGITPAYVYTHICVPTSETSLSNLPHTHNLLFNSLLLGFSRTSLKWLKCPVRLLPSTTRSL